MAFTNTGVFTPDTKTQFTPLEQLINTAKKKSTGATAVAEPANVFAPTSGNTGVSSGDTTNPQNYDTYTPRTDEVLPDAEVEDVSSKSKAPEPPAGITPETHYISDDPESPYYWQTLGYADATWVGLPLEIGWWEQDDEGNNTNWITQKDMRSVAEQLHELQNIAIPERPGLIDLTTTSAYGGIQDLIDIWNDPNRTQADKDAAIASYEQQMGQAPGWFANQMAAMYGQMSTGIMGQQGLTEEYQDAYNRETQLELQSQRRDYQKMIEAMSAQGRNVAGFQKMDEIVNTLSSYQMQRDVQLLNTDLAMKQAEYNALKDRYQQLFDNEQISSTQFQEALNQNRLNALTGYAQQISTIVSQNQLTLQAYQADLSAIQLHAETVYKGIMADIGVSESMMTQMQDFYEMYMAPHFAELQQYSIEAQIEMSKQGQTTQQIGTVLGAAGTGATIGAAVGGPVGAVVGGIIGIIGGLIATVSSGSLICTELHRQKLMDEITYRHDTEFGQRVANEYPQVFAGYQKLAAPIVEKMRKSSTFTWFINLFVKQWSKEMLHLLGKRKNGSIIGKIIIYFGFKLCAIAGREYGYVGSN